MLLFVPFELTGPLLQQLDSTELDRTNDRDEEKQALSFSSRRA